MIDQVELNVGGGKRGQREETVEVDVGWRIARQPGTEEEAL